MKSTYLRRYDELQNVLIHRYIPRVLPSMLRGRTASVRPIRGAYGEDVFKFGGWVGSTNNGLHMFNVKCRRIL